MTSTMIPPLSRGVLVTGKRVGRAFHLHVLGAAIIRDQLADGDVMVEFDGEEVVRMRTERQMKVPRPTPRVEPIAFPHIEPDETTKLILGIPFRRDLPPAAR